MLRPAWGYVDQPPLTPLVAHGLASLYDGGPWLVRIPATLCAAALPRAHRADRPRAGRRREGAGLDGLGDGDHLGGAALRPRLPDLVARPGRLAAGLAAGDAGRAARRAALVAGRPARWPGSRRTTSCWSLVLLAGIAAGLAVVGPRARLRSPYVWGGAALTVLIGLPERRLPADPRPAPAPDGARAVGEQRRRRAGEHVGAAARAARAAAGGDLGGRVAGAVARPAGAVLRRGVRRSSCSSRSSPARSRTTRCSSCRSRSRPASWRWSRTSAGSGAPCSRSTARCRWCSGCRWSRSARSARRRSPTSTCWRRTPIGWPAYVRQVAAVYDALPDRAHAAVFTSNYGEAGAVHHYRPDLPVYSAQNALYDQARPPDDVTTVVFVGGQYPEVRRLFDHCDGAGPARQRCRRRQRGAGRAGRRLHGPDGAVGRPLAAAAPPGLSAPVGS